MKQILKLTFLAPLLLLFFLSRTEAQVRLPLLFSDNMVLQQGMAIPVWGWASPGEKITITLDKATVKTKADKAGKWMAKLPAMNYGGPLTLTVQGKDLHTFQNVMIGEVWVCSGQSNMEFSLRNAKNAETEEIPNSKFDQIRLFTVSRRISQSPQDELTEGKWSLCSSATSPNFSAVAYFFGKALYKKLNVPIGLIHSSWGGTVAETWTSGNTISKNPDFAQQLDFLKKINLDDYAKAIEKEVKERVGEFSTVDLGYKADVAVWAAPDFDDHAWKLMKVPGYIEQNGLPGVDGIIWFRKEIQLTADEAGKTASLSLAKINDSDQTFLNGTLIGSTKLAADKPRVYSIPAGLLKTGKNVLTVQVEDVGGMGGIYGDTIALHLKMDTRKIALSGDWKYKVGLVKFNTVLNPNSYPTLLYNGMIHALIPYGIRGAIWYQGEGNANRAKQYQRVFPDLIKDWRTQWNQGDFPFLFVQLANFMKADTIPQESPWAELREAQSKTLALPNTGMAVIIDAGDAVDIHPKDKQTVGNRLALAGLKVAYHQDLVYSGPVYQRMVVNGRQVALFFDQVGSGLKLNDKYGYLKGFAVAGDDHIFHWAVGHLAGKNSVVIYSSEVAHPVAVRYGWGNNPDDLNLYNSENLPASPFRTDTWKGITE